MELTILNGKNNAGGTRIKSTADLYRDDFPELISNIKIQDLLNTIDKKAGSCIKLFSVPAIEFAMTKDSMSRFADGIANIARSEEDCDIYEAVYEAVNKNGTLYRFGMVMNITDPEEEGVRTRGYLYRKKPGDGWEKYNLSGRVWHGGEDIQMLFDCMEGTGAKKAFADAMKESLGISLQATGVNYARHCMKNAKSLFELYDRLDGLGQFQMICVHNGFPEDRTDESFKMALRSEDYDRMGCCIYFEEGKYHICQMHDTEQNEDGLIFFDTGKPMDKNSFFCEVCETDDLDMLCTLLESMWDRSCRRRKWLTLPISDRAYVSFRENEMIDDKIHYICGNPEPTGNEEYAMKQLKKVLQKGTKND